MLIFCIFLNIMGFMKMKKIIKVMYLCTMGVVGACMVGCGEKGDSNTLVMGCSAEYPPFEYRKNGELIGFDVDLAKAICKKLGYILVVKDMNFDGLIGALNSGRVDFVMSGMTVTEERMKRVDFSRMYYEPKLAIIYRKDEVVDEAEKMKGKSIGVQLGSTMEIFVKEKANEMEGVEVKALNRNPDLIQELKIGRIDAVVIEESQVEQFGKANSDLAYRVLEDSAGEGYAIAFQKGSDLKEKFNKVLEEMKGNGELAAMLKKWEL